MSVNSKMNTQQGGMKLVVKNDKGQDISIRKVRDIKEFISIFSNTIHVQEVAVNSVSAFILRITLPVDTTPFRSDIFDDRGRLMNVAEYRMPNTGQVVTQHILKCFIIQPNPLPRIAPFTAGRNKGTATKQELIQEYNSQYKIYNGSMAYGGMPVCPDVYALMELNVTQFREIFFSDNLPLPPGSIRSFPSIQSNLFKQNKVFKYLLEQLEAPLPLINGKRPEFERKVGFILMESLSPSYEPLTSLYETFSSALSKGMITRPVFAKRKLLFDEMTYRALAICILVFYRIGYIPLDAHMGNWMYDPTQVIEQFKLRAIDFGRVLQYTGVDGINHIQHYVRSYIRLYENPSEKRRIIAELAKLLGIDPSTINTAEMSGTVVGEIFKDLAKLIRHNQNGSILWNTDGSTFTIVTHPSGLGFSEQTMEVDSCMILIHKIIFLIALVDGCFNSSTYRNHHFCQLRDLFSSLFVGKCNNLRSMIDHSVYIDFVSYLNAMPDYTERIRTIETYGRIRDYIGNYLRVSPERGLFPDPFYQEPSPDTAMVAPPPPRSRPHSPRKSPSKLSPKKTQVSPLAGSPTAEQYERFISGHTVTHKPSRAVMPGGNINKKLIKSVKKIKLKKSRNPITTKFSKIMKTKKNKNHNKVRRNRRYRF